MSTLETLRSLLQKVRLEHDAMHAALVEQESKDKDVRKNTAPVNRTATRSEPSIASRVNEALENAVIRHNVYLFMLDRLKADAELERRRSLQLEGQKQAAAQKIFDVNKAIEHKRTAVRNAQKQLADAAEVNLIEQNDNESSLREMRRTVEDLREQRRRRQEFEEWRAEFARHAAEAASASNARHLNLIWGFQRLVSNSLVERQTAQRELARLLEEKFSMIREATGLDSIHLIAENFLVRERDHKELEFLVVETESQLESLRNDTVVMDGEGTQQSRIEGNRIDLSGKPEATDREQGGELEHIRKFLLRVQRIDPGFQIQTYGTGKRISCIQSLLHLDSRTAYLVQRVAGARSSTLE